MRLIGKILKIDEFVTGFGNQLAGPEDSGRMGRLVSKIMGIGILLVGSKADKFIAQLLADSGIQFLIR